MSRPPYMPGDAEFTSFKCMDIYKDEPMPRKHQRLGARNITIECPGCKVFCFIHRNQWPAKKSGKRLGCLHCGAHEPSRKWRLLSVPWMRVAA
jgi:hypothetical protein